MIALLASASFAAPLPLPMPAGTLCAPGAAVSAYAGPTYYDGDSDWMAPVECTDEADCLARLARLDDPRVTLQNDRAARAETDEPVPTGVAVHLQCDGTPAGYTWTCDAAGCALTSRRQVASLRWTSLAFDALPGRPDRTVTELVELDDATLKSRGTTQLADLVKGTARRMDAALARCAEGVPCDAGWEATRALTTPFLTDGRATFVSFERGMWGSEGFEATFTAAADPAAEVTLSCYLLDGGCGLAAATCALAFGPADAPLATFTANDDTTKWGTSSMGLERVTPGEPVLVTRQEGWRAAAAASGVETAAR